MIELTAGWTAPLDFQLLNGNTPRALTGCTVVAILKDRRGAAVDMAGDLTVIDVDLGKVRISPDATDFAEAGSPFTLRFQVTDSNSKVSFHPAGNAETVKVYRP